MSYEKTTKENPRQLIVNQHIVPKMLISNFCNNNGFVEVKRIENNKVFLVKASNSIFCARRTWDQRAEKGWMKQIEDNFNNSFSDIVNRGFIVNHQDVTKYFALWAIKSEYDKNPPPDTPLNRVSPGNLSKDEQEILESKHACYVDENSNMKSRFMISISAQRDHDMFMQKYRDVRWGVFTSKDRPFVVPKYCPEYMIILLSPTIAVYANSANVSLTSKETLDINAEIIKNEKSCIFTSSIQQAMG